jgi:hypothetical protein
VPQFFFIFLCVSSFHGTPKRVRADDDYDELLNVNNLSTNENKADTGFLIFFGFKLFIKMHFI